MNTYICIIRHLLGQTPQPMMKKDALLKCNDDTGEGEKEEKRVEREDGVDDL